MCAYMAYFVLADGCHEVGMFQLKTHPKADPTINSSTDHYLDRSGRSYVMITVLCPF